MIAQPDSFYANTPIWSHAGTPAQHEVVLFRSTFKLAEPLADAAIALFADTRYQLWVDGKWAGRGPARFSRRTHEYDVQSIGTLAPGLHTVAVLVQWAPNLRRSESSVPFLLAQVQGRTAQGITIVTRTGPHWKAIVSSAWRSDAALVHAWDLIGPSELLDLRQLPPGWMQPGFSDAAWPAASVARPPQARYLPRSLPPLADVPMPATVKDVGLLSPGRAIVELAAGAPALDLTAHALTTLTIETLATAIAAPGDIQLDGVTPAWQPLAGRPDVVSWSPQVWAGRHALSFSAAQSPILSISTENLTLPAVPIQQGVHAGRRLLLAEPVSRPAAVAVSSGAGGIALKFAGPPSYAVLDLGRVVHGRISADISGPAGTVVDIGWDERLWQGTRPLPHPGTLHPQWNQADSWVLDNNVRSISTVDARAGRYVLIAAWGGPAQISDLRVYEERYPTTQRGQFVSADPLLARIWQIGVDTLYPNMTDAYADPWRERGQWWGDAFVADHSNQVAFGETRLLRRGLALMAEGLEGGRPKSLAPNGDGNHMVDYGMLWVQSLSDYQRITGDSQFTSQVYARLIDFISHLARYQNPTTGLLDLPHGPWWRTALIDWYAPDSRYGQSTALNAMYYGTLLAAADVADSVGDSARAQAWRQTAGTLKDQINAQLYRPGEGQYITSIVPDGVRPPTLHAQAWALAYGVVPEQEQQRVADALLALISPDPKSPNLGIYGMFWVLEGLGRAGRIPEAVALIKTYYGYLLDLGATTWWEGFEANRSYTASLSHGWGTAPTWFLTTYVLGARRSGSNTWQVHLPADALPSMEGALPLRSGVLQVRWDSRACGISSLELVAPPDSAGVVLIPDAAPLTLTLDGVLIWQSSLPLGDQVTNQPDGVRLKLGGGPHRLEVEHTCITGNHPFIAR